MGDLPEDPEALRKALEAAEAEAAQRNLNMPRAVRRIIIRPGEDEAKAVAEARADGADYVITRIIAAGSRDRPPQVLNGPDPVAVAARLERERQQEQEPQPRDWAEVIYPTRH